MKDDQTVPLYQPHRDSTATPWPATNDPTVIPVEHRLGTPWQRWDHPVPEGYDPEVEAPTTYPFLPEIAPGLRNYVAWGWTDNDLHRAIEADAANRDEYLRELAIRRVERMQTQGLVEAHEAEIQAEIAKQIGLDEL